jgi:hypothetical protein
MRAVAPIRAAVERLLSGAEVALSIDAETGVWTLDIAAHDLSAGVTHRHAKVSVETRDGLVESLQPAEFLNPPPGREAWDTLFAFAAALQNEDAAPRLEQFDRSMPGFEDLKTAITALWTQWQIEPALDLLSNEGDDEHRTLQISWALTLKNPQDPVDSVRHEDSIACRLEKQGKTWRIVGFSPANLFSLPKR